MRMPQQPVMKQARSQLPVPPLRPQIYRNNPPPPPKKKGGVGGREEEEKLN